MLSESLPTRFDSAELAAVLVILAGRSLQCGEVPGFVDPSALLHAAGIVRHPQPETQLHRLARRSLRWRPLHDWLAQLESVEVAE